MSICVNAMNDLATDPLYLPVQVWCEASWNTKIMCAYSIHNNAKAYSGCVALCGKGRVIKT